MVETLRGSITSVAFESGDQFVVGHWPSSPIGSFADVMWRDRHDVNRLIATPAAADYITTIYPFDHRVEAAVQITESDGSFEVVGGPLRLRLDLGRVTIPFPPRPRKVTETVERWVARTLLGVNTYGRSPTGVEEWYRTRSVRRVVGGQAVLDGYDLGPLTNLDRPMEVGFSNPPRLPTQVRLRVDVGR